MKPILLILYLAVCCMAAFQAADAATYYVNDGSTNGDVYCTATGSVVNAGTNAAAPAASLKDIVDDYDLDPGDVVYIDSGYYNEGASYPVFTENQDQGSPSDYLYIIGSTNQAVPTELRGSWNVLELKGCDYLYIKNLTIRQASNLGLFSSRNITGCRIENCVFYGNSMALVFYGGSDNIVRRCAFIGNTHAVAHGSSGLKIEHCVFWSNSYFNSTFTSAGTETYSNCVVAGGGVAGQTGVLGYRYPRGDYNVFWDISFAPDFSGLNAMQKNLNDQWHSTYANPHINYVTNWTTYDFHPKSLAGRYNPATSGWVTDAVHSVLIDFGPTNFSVGSETAPNGNRLNAGYYGGTDEASRSVTNPSLLALTYNQSGGVLIVPGNPVYWRANNIETDATVRIELALDGVTFGSVVETNLPALDGMYTWANTNYSSSTNARWRVVLEDDPSVYDACDATFEHRNGVYVYYVNDNSIVGDGTDWGLGNDINAGLEKGAPKASVQSVLNQYTLSRGDRIVLGVGKYTLGSTLSFGPEDGGDTNDYVYIQGSTNSLNGGTILRNAGIYVNGADHLYFQRIGLDGMSTGFRINNSDSIVFENGSIQETSLDGLLIESSTNIFIQNSVLWGNSRYSVRVSSGWVSLSNTVVAVDADSATALHVPGTSSIRGDYNAVYAASNSRTAYISGPQRHHDTLAAWVEATTSLVYSISTDPLFADPANNDFHLKTEYSGGRYNPQTGSWTRDLVTSPLIDSGAPMASADDEPATSSHRINIGKYGNTSQAGTRPDEEWLVAGYPRHGGWISETGAFHWVAGGALTNGTVQIDVSTNAGQSWVVLASGLAANTELYEWDASSFAAGPSYLWRVVSESDTNVNDQSEDFFAVRDGPVTFYVNDASAVGDEYCSATGSASNWQASVSAPMDSLSSVFDLYDVEPGDRIVVDVGNYTNAGTLGSLRRDSGRQASQVVIHGASLCPFSSTVMFSVGDEAAMSMSQAGSVSISNLTLRGDARGLVVEDSASISVFWVAAETNDSDGFYLDDCSDLVVRRCVSRENGGYGFQVSDTDGMDLYQSIAWSNDLSAVRLNNADVNVIANVLQASGSGTYVYDLQSSSSVDADYNNILVQNDAQSARQGTMQYRDLYAWQDASGDDVSSLSHDPQFADPAGDFHIKTTVTTGRYVSCAGYSQTDAVQSPLLDAGPKTWFPGSEAEPNGDRVNIGLYGNTAESSKSPTNGWFLTLTLNSGGQVRGTNELYWLAGGGAADAGVMVNVQYTLDGGGTWSNIATNVSVSLESVVWDTGDLTAPSVFWRIVSTDGVYGATCDVAFVVNNGPLAYYVNDSQSSGDVYCSAPGSELNTGLDPGAPKNSISSILNDYTLRPGDFLYIDTGYYELTEDVVFKDISGNETNRLQILGSSNENAGGTRIDGGGLAGFRIESSDSIQIEDFRFEDCPDGLVMYRSTNTLVQNVRVVGNGSGTGFSVEYSPDTRIEHSIAAHNEYGVNQVMNSGRGCDLISSVLWSNQYGVYVSGGNVSVSNSVLCAFGSDSFAYYVSGGKNPVGTFFCDFNGIYLANDARAAYGKYDSRNTEFFTVSDWRRLCGQDEHSITKDPLFADPAGFDFHLKSETGRWDAQSSSFVTDSYTSPLIDAGSGTYSNELPNNGNWRNIGLHGNTFQASKSPVAATESSITVISLDDGGQIAGTNTIRWAVSGPVTGGVVTIQYRDLAIGNGWNTIATDVPAADRAYLWDASSLTSSVLAAWRVTVQTNTIVTSQSSDYFAIRNDPIYFYVNDTSTNNDVYCSATGSDANYGVRPDKPKRTLQNIVDSYDVEPGDIISVDSGTYSLSADILIGQYDGGSSNSPVRIQGSTNDWSAGTRFTGRGLDLTSVWYLEVANLAFDGGNQGVVCSGAKDCLIEWVLCDQVAGSPFTLNNSSGIRLRHNVAVECNSGLILSGSSTDNSWAHGVLWSNASHGVNISSGSEIALSNSIMGVYGSSRYAYYYQPSSGGGLVADYNNILLGDGAYAGYWQKSDPIVYESVSRWARDFGQDPRSLSVEPGFASVTNRDFHLHTTELNGRYQYGVGWTQDVDQISLLIDAGFGAYTNEPAPNGSHANIGLYGNTWQASKTPTNGWLTVVSLNDGGRFEGTNYLYWATGGAVTGEHVVLSYSSDGGGSWTQVAVVAAADRGYLWDSTGYESSPLGLWKISSTNHPDVADQTDELFALRNEALNFYVNDIGQAGDQYTSAIGRKTNTGAYAWQPKASIQDVIDTYDLEPGDTLFVDTGTYYPTNRTRVWMLDEGTTNQPVHILGSTNRVAGGSVIQGYGLYVDTAEGLDLRQLSVTNASTGIEFKSVASGSMSWMRIEGCSTGVKLDSADTVSLQNTLIRESTSRGIHVVGSEADIQNCVLWKNRSHGLYYQSGTVGFSNNVVVVDGSGRYAYYYASPSPGGLKADYNNIFLTNSANCGFSRSSSAGELDPVYQTVARWVRDFGQDQHSLSHDPGFVDPDNGDFHLKTTRVNGRYQDGFGWTNDIMFSLLIDAGTGDGGSEPDPGSTRRNIGLYGGTAQASLTPTGGWFTAITANDGGRLEGATNLNWVAGGIATGHTVSIDYSSDWGQNWQSVTSGISASVGGYEWNSSGFTSSIHGVWRITSEQDGLIADVTDSPFALRNTPLYFYVNDTDPATLPNDVYCSVIGNTTNWGTYPHNPKMSIQAVFDQWDLEPGDTVYVDTGTFGPLASSISIDRFDAGSAGMPVTIQGSTNLAAGGTVISKFGSGYCISISQAEGIALRDLTLENGSGGVNINQSDSFSSERVIGRSGGVGFNLVKSDNAEYSHCVADHNSSAGLYVDDSENVSWMSGVLWSNEYGVHLVDGSVEVKNSIFGIRGCGFFVEEGTIESDYNNLYAIRSSSIIAAELGSVAGGGTGRYQNVASWAFASGNDVHSLTLNPAFTDEGDGDYHLKSAGGKYQYGAGWVTNDVVTSPLIDAGDPASGFGAEPEPNGSRINMGLYGGTEYASKTFTNGGLVAVSFNDGGSLTGLVSFTWIAQGVVTGHQVTIQVTIDDKANWTTVGGPIGASIGFYQWDSSLLPNTPRGYWRVVSVTDTSILSETEAPCYIRNGGGISYYVNDDSRDNDVFTTAKGNPNYHGAAPDLPKDDIRDILDEYDVEPGDTIYVDTGYYEVSGASITIGEYDSGLADNPVVIQGSTNVSAQQRTVFDRALGGPYVFEFYYAGGIDLRDLVVQQGESGIKLEASSAIRAINIVSRKNEEYGYELTQSEMVLLNSVSYDNDVAGILISSDPKRSASLAMTNSVVWDNPSAILLQGVGAKATVRNSVLNAFGQDELIYELGMTGNVDSDYNNLIVEDGAYVAKREQVQGGDDFYGNVTSWRRGDEGQDFHSLSHDPMFADADNGDFHPMSEAGRYTSSGSFTNDDEDVFSPLLDAGNGAVLYTNEPAPNGGRINVGVHGGTQYASKSNTNAWLLAVSFNDGGVINGSNAIYWLYGGQVQSNDYVQVEYSDNNGIEYDVVKSNLLAGAGQYGWDVTHYPLTTFGKWRVVWQAPNDTNVLSETEEAFAIRNEPQVYYVNDNSQVGDVYTLTPGRSTNTGRSVSSPLDSITRLFEIYAIGAGDRIYIDTGTYTLTNTWSINEFTRGEEGLPIHISGSTNYAEGGTVLVAESGNEQIRISNSRYILIDNLSFMDGTGISVANSLACSFTNVISSGHAGNGFEFSLSGVTCKKCTSWDNSGYGVRASTTPLVWSQGVIWDNAAGAVSVNSSAANVNNSILGALESGSYIYTLNLGSINADYNILWTTNGAGLAYNSYGFASYVYLSEWQSDYNSDEHSVIVDPLFVDSDNGNFYLQSQQGRYDITSGVWTQDTVTSWAIDAANPSLAYTNEPMPNGNRLNAGIYGNTQWASMSRSNTPEIAISTLNDGGSVQPNQPVYWVWRGMDSTNTVTIEYSPDNGLTWTQLVTGFAIDAEDYDWPATNYTQTVLGRLRILVDGNTNIVDTTENTFFLRLGPVEFYVNDDDMTADVYCQAPGSSTNLGLGPTVPLASVQQVLDRYDVEPGDIIYVDSGTYTQDFPILVTSLDAGSSASPVTIIGSTNYFVPTIFNPSSATGIRFSQGPYYTLKYLTITNAGVAVSVERSSGFRMEHCRLMHNASHGFSANIASGAKIQNSVIAMNSGSALNMGVGSMSVDHSVLWANSNSAVSIAQASATVSNSVVHATGEGKYLYQIGLFGSVSGDYNDLWAEDGAYYVSDGSELDVPAVIHEGVPQWVAASGNDVHSLNTDPLFADPENGNFRPKSTVGRYFPVTELHELTDATNSPLVDAGDPNRVCVEPAPNGDRINIGAYGNTAEASLSETSRWVRIVTGMGGGRLEGVFYLVWNGGGMDATNEVELYYSKDNRASWKQITTEEPVSLGDGEYLWNSALKSGGSEVYESSPMGWMRIQLAEDSNVVSETETFFALRNSPFVYYVNDSSTNGDVFTTAIGSSNNFGFFDYSPKDSLVTLLRDLDMESGDQIRVDTGVYTNSVTISSSDAGDAGARVVISASTNGPGVIQQDGSISAQGGYIEIENMKFYDAGLSGSGAGVLFDNLVVSNGSVSISGAGGSFVNSTVVTGNVSASSMTTGVFERLEIRDGRMSISGSSGVEVRNVLVFGDEGPALTVSDSPDTTVHNCTLATDGTAFRQQDSSSYSDLKNNILVADGIGEFCIHLIAGTIDSDYNNLVPRNYAWVGNKNGNWERLIYWQRESDKDEHSFSAAPGFESEAGRDYHLATNSVCIDAGDPADPVGDEPWPNSFRINQGAYGGTEEATISHNGLLAVSLRDGGVVKGTNVVLRWFYSNVSPTNYVNLLYSMDNGITWSSLVDNMDITIGEYVWDTTPITNSIFTRWKVELAADTNIYSVNERRFAIRNGLLGFYVNDGSTNGDVFCTTTGNVAAVNTGLSPDDPRLSLREITDLDYYDTEAGDTIYIDTGYYLETNNIQVIWSRSSREGTNLLLICGSTNFADGGTVMDRGSRSAGNYALDIRASNVKIRDITIQTANRGINFQENRRVFLDNIFGISNSFATIGTSVSDFWIRYSKFWENSFGGVTLDTCRTGYVENCTFVNNTPYSYRVLDPIDMTLQNNIFYITDNGAAAISGTVPDPDDIFIDYNIYYFTKANNYIYGTYTNLLPWQLQVEHDYRSNITNPLLADVQSGDFHPRSEYGRYLDGYGWTNDLATSWAVDRGNPDQDYDNEPEETGERRNIGAYGNTIYASKGTTNVVRFARILNDEIAITVTNYFWPLIWSSQNMPTDFTVRVQYSGDGGSNWLSLATNVNVFREYILWETSPYYNTYQGRWRIVGESDTNYWDINDAPFTIFYGNFELDLIRTTDDDLREVRFRGAWNEEYQVQYTTNGYYWTNAVDGVEENQIANFITDRGGDFDFEDIESSNSFRNYRVLWRRRQ